MSNEELPQPTNNARSISSLTVAVISDLLFVGSNTINYLWQRELEKRFKHGQDVLVAAVERRGIRALEDQNLSFFISSSYTFFERVRLGEAKYNLRLISEYIADGLTSPLREPSHIARIAQIIGGLTEFEISVLVAAQKMSDQAMMEDEKKDFTFSAFGLTRVIFDGNHERWREVDAALSMLAARALLTSISEARLGANPMSYRLSLYADELIKVATKLEK